MSGSITLFELLAQLGGAEVALRREEEMDIAVAVFSLANGRQVLAVERLYRDGIRIIIDPTPEEIATAREGDMWHLWNSDRAALLHSMV
jgi:hypothetical protein